MGSCNEGREEKQRGKERKLWCSSKGTPARKLARDGGGGETGKRRREDGTMGVLVRKIFVESGERVAKIRF